MLIGKKSNVRIDRIINIKIRDVVCDSLWESTHYEVRSTAKTPTWNSLWDSVGQKHFTISIWK